ncbi:uncharacterized protein LOC143177973 isoform X2 [Calliopsis andreniformis]|uniref:uncharacterized protein LOC143177973 isoform X2 n=1 Tax=Calliopsis andreniformis TaxID=337506 RepID=UPI003FCE891E
MERRIFENARDASRWRTDVTAKKHFSGPWNNILPCYVVDIEPANTTENLKLHEDSRKQTLEDQVIREFEEKYREYMDNNLDVSNTMSSNMQHTKMTLQGLEKMPTISPHVYSLLGPSHELRIKQALAEGMTRKKFFRSNMELSLDERSLSFRLDDDDDLLSRATNASNRNWVTRSTYSPSRRSTIGSLFKLDYGITMLKRSNPNEPMMHRSRNSDATRDFVTIKSSFRGMKEAPSKTSSTKSPFRGIFEYQSSTNSILSSWNPDLTVKKFRKRIYLNTPISGLELESNAIVPILVNYQVQALVQTALDVLKRVNPEKLKGIMETARDMEEMKRMLLRPNVQQFLQSLSGQSLLSCPECFVISVAAVADEIDFKFEGIMEKEIVALTLELPALPCLDALVAEIRSNIFFEAKKKARLNENKKKVSSASEGKGKRKDEGRGLDGRSLKRDKEQQQQIDTINKDKYSEVKKFKQIDGSKKSINEKQSSMERSNWANKIVGQSNEDSITEASAMPGIWQNSKMKTGEQRGVSGNALAKRTSNSKSWKVAQDSGHLDADHVILRRMTNAQRILVGQMCASLKTKKINNQGLINESVPLAALITPALSRDSIKVLTRGTVYSKRDTTDMQPGEAEDNTIITDKLTGPLLAKIRQDIAESETKRRLTSFLKNET